MDWRFIGKSLVYSLIVAFLIGYLIETLSVWWDEVFRGDPRDFNWSTVFEFVEFLEMMFILFFIIPYSVKRHRRNQSLR